jgi:hypothetical protein
MPTCPVTWVGDITCGSVRIESPFTDAIRMHATVLCYAMTVSFSVRGVTGLCGQTLGTSATYQNRKICPCQRVSGNIQFVSYGGRNTVLIYSVDIHLSPAVQDAISNTGHERWLGRGVASALARFQLSGYSPVGTPKCPWIRSTSPSHCGCLSAYPQLPRQLCTDAAAHDETGRGVLWISLRTFWALIVNVLFQL